jgi:HEPN domain-containing protein
LDIGSYHCQQAAEKALKGWLTANEILYPKTHSLQPLVDLCIASNGGFTAFRSHAEELTPLAQQFRYPGDAQEPAAHQAEHALILAEEVCSFCQGQLASLK